MSDRICGKSLDASPEVVGIERPLRILAISDTWQGATDYGYVRAFRRAGHSVMVCSSDPFFSSGWKSKPLRALRRVIAPLVVRDYNAHLVASARDFRPDLLFVFKGREVTADTLRSLRAKGAIAINIYPDVSMTLHGPYLLAALGCYDWIFTTKSYGLNDLQKLCAVSAASFMEHGFDPETHRPLELSSEDRERYRCDASFIGTWSPKKEYLLSQLIGSMSAKKLLIWGHFWEKSKLPVGSTVKCSAVTGDEYAKAICGSSINIALMSEVRSGASSGDLTSTRTFEIPAIGGFMLHERNDEVQQFFKEGEECAMFSSADELAAKVAYYLDRPQERQRIAAAGYLRALNSGYSTDDHARKVVAKFHELKAARVSRGSEVR